MSFPVTTWNWSSQQRDNEIFDGDARDADGLIVNGGASKIPCSISLGGAGWTVDSPSFDDLVGNAACAVSTVP